MPRRARRQGDWGDVGKGLFFLSPWMFGYLVFTITPILMTGYFSLSEYSVLQDPVYVGMQNYRDLMTDKWFGNALINTAQYAAMALPGGMMVSLGLALLLNQPIRGQAVYRTIIFLPSLVPVTASAMIWLWLFNTKLGLINFGLDKIGLPGVGWLTNPNVALPALAFMSLWGVGHTVVIYLAGLQDVPRELYEAAEIDGAGIWGRLLNVTLPTISPVLFFDLIMAIIGTLQVFTIPYIMTQGGPQRSTYFYTMYLYDNAFNFLRMGYASAMAWIQFMIVLGLTGLAFWTGKRWVHYQGR